MAIDVSEPEAGLTLVTLSNPGRRNALNESMFRELAALWPRLEASTTRCIVVTGAGNAFCSGADLSVGLPTVPDIDALIDAALLKSRTFRKPMIAAISGACVAGGLELALSCEVRICAPDARLGLPEARWGIFPAGGAAIRLVEEIGYAPAAELLVTGRLITASEALALGLINRVTAPCENVLSVALQVAREIAANSPTAVSAIKTYLSAARRPALPLRELELSLTHAVRASDDAKEGINAFLEKRNPSYLDRIPECIAVNLTGEP